jgi:hypothetical protein
MDARDAGGGMIVRLASVIVDESGVVIDDEGGKMAR